ncbi:GFA family protein [Rhodovulum adriaticum]|uniref:CENP-V/GFA domain-containing protein n=1 Tax=Rhodovulum adriaticum TaxID=35804 RepID=A0A4R2NLF6_RHOAD|nr:GFA family protein [Rhodovulum adriaticum]MBK1635149.1 aldehyde-activating protein [Rhodovulum adriaticum]TCP22262.1 hypothetical protein EV656_10771 [Rhodovulum adriaticum]
MTHRLTCHCGAIEIEVDLPEGALENATRCDCSFCRRRGAIMAGVPLDALRIVKGADHIALYQFNTMTAEHHFCPTCGIYTHHRRRANPNEYGINVGALEGINPRDLGAVRWSDGVHHVCDRK